MQISVLTPTNLRRHAAAIFAINELIKSQQLDGHEFMTDTLLGSYYGIEHIATELETLEREERIKRVAEHMNKNK